MNLLTLAVLCICLSSCTCLELPGKLSIGDNAIVLLVLATFGTLSLIGACAFCFRKKKTFEKLENEAGSPENLKKNEYPIFRALATDVTESSAIVPGERNNLSRDNLLNSSDNLTTPDHQLLHHHDGSNGSLRKLDVVDSSDVVVLLDKSLSQRDRSSRDTITFETEKKHQHSPSSKTPLLYAKNVQSYQEQPPINEQIQQKSVASNLLSHCEKTSSSTSFDGFYNIRGVDDTEKLDEIDDFINSNKNSSVSSDNNNGTAMGTSSVINPFFNSTNEEFQCVKEVSRDKDDTSEVESSINDNSEKYQILEEETDGEDIKIDDSPAIKQQHRKNSDYSMSEDKSVEEALKALDMAIGFEDDDEEEIFEENTDKLDEIKEEATFLVDSIVNDCEKILEEKQNEEMPSEFDDFLSLNDKHMSTPCAANKTSKFFSSDNENVDIAKVLFPGGVDLGDATFPINETYQVNDKTFDAAPPPIITIEKDKDEVSSEDLTTVTPVNTPIELSYSSETWDKMSYSNTNKGAISKIPQKPTQQEESPKEEPTFNQDGWYLHPLNSSVKNGTFDIYCDDEENDEGNMDMSSTFDQLRRQLTEMLPHAQGMSVHNDFLDDNDDLTRSNKDSSSPSDNYGIKYGDLDEATNAGSFDLLGAIVNPEPVTELNINYHNVKRSLSPILEESECDETCRTFVFNNETKLLDSTSTGMMESASASDAVGQMGQVPKALMASNDTLFNFEDTLSDQTDNLLMSPRMNTAGSSTSSTLSRQESHDRISNERTPTNEDLPKIGEFNAIDIVKHNIRQHPLSLDLNQPDFFDGSTKYEITRAALEDGSWPLELPEAQQIVNDLSSPDQNRTADSLSFEQDITYTIDDQKTCVSLVLKNDEERISEISEPLFASESFDAFADDANSLQIDDAISLEIDDNCNLEINDENGNQNGATKDIELHLNETSSLNYDNDSINPGEGGGNLSKCEFEIDSLEPEAKILNEDIEVDSIPASQATKSVYSADSMNDDLESPDTVQSNETSESSNSTASPQKRQLDSSEESDLSNKAENKEKVPSTISLTSSSGKLTTLQDYLFNEVFYANDGCGCSPKDFLCNYHDQWESPDIRQVSCNNAMMSTSFTKEWSDDDSSHSSEEFMYVKGTLDTEKILSPTDNEKSTENKKEEEVASEEHKSSENMDVDDLPVENDASKPTEMEVHSDDESAEESEFFPSCWDQSLKPSKSSLKSPEREGSVEQQPVKTRGRRVAFKIQRYHSVYEYPSETVQLSPAYSEPQLWSNYDYSGNIDFFTYTNPLAELADNFDGFNISSSSRPFHNAHNIQIHNTWPNETTDFSWSQYQDNNEKNCEDTPSSKIEWPTREDDSGCMCESSESPSMGELNHHKNAMRLPLELISSTCSEVSDFMSTTDVLTKDLDAVKLEISNDESPKPNTIINIEEDDVLVDEEDDKLDDSILPTPLSGSIDSLSSSSHSASTNNSSPPSFTTFGKETILKENEMGEKTQTIIFIEEDITKLTRIDSQKKGRNEAIEKGGVLLQSSDDDSGFENVQIKCEQ